jgi:mRNA interferase HigB
VPSGAIALPRQHTALEMSHLGTILVVVRIIAIRTLREFWESEPEAESPVRAWADEVRAARWQQPMDIKAQYGSASILKNRRVVFNIGGNKYRLVATVTYRFQAVFVKFIGTHAQYDLIDADTVEHDR